MRGRNESKELSLRKPLITFIANEDESPTSYLMRLLPNYFLGKASSDKVGAIITAMKLKNNYCSSYYNLFIVVFIHSLFLQNDELITELIITPLSF